MNPYLFIFVLLTLTVQGANNDYGACQRLFYNCGTITGVGYPLWGNSRPDYCGNLGFKLTCEENQSYSVLKILGSEFRVLEINQTDSTMRIARNDVWKSPCLHNGYGNTSLDDRFFGFVDRANQNLTLFYNCSGFQNLTSNSNPFNCFADDQISRGYYLNDSILENYQRFDWFDDCYENSIRVPILSTSMNLLISKSDPLSLQGALNRGFGVEFSEIGKLCQECEHSGMVCIYEGMFRCIPIDGNFGVEGAHSNRLRNLAIGLGAGFGGILITCAAYYCITRIVSLGSSLIFWKKTESGRNAEAILKHHGSLALKRYNFSEIKKMTNSFKEKLGQGGYGSVFKGKMLDDRLVAVKLLNEAKGNGEEFINEVASISRTSHVNFVSLLGFCLQGQRRALIYEFMPNGSLEKFIYCESQPLGWKKLYQIATGVARGLEYLHRGCNTRILHFDIKPHNILLDENFIPKISDFGLAKLYPAKQSSTISILGARGTIGYIAPEVFNRHFGGVSHKSDVYSYGMMLMEMVGGRKNFDVGADHTSEIYFPYWLYTHLQVDTEFKLRGGMSDEEIKIAKKIIMVGLWCIQTIPSERPSMSKVIDMLEGSLGDVEIPPRPYLSSSPPPISPISRSLSDSPSTPLTLKS